MLYPPGLGSAGATNPYSTNTTAGSVPGISVLRSSSGAGDLAYNVITWDPRGEFQSGGILQLDNPMYEGRDTSAVIDWVASTTPANLNGANDPVIGMVGGSYGGGIQMTTVDPRLEAIVPTIAWNSLNQSLYPDNIFKTGWANTLGLALLTTGARINGEIYPALIMGNLVGSIRQTAQAVLGGVEDVAAGADGRDLGCGLGRSVRHVLELERHGRHAALGRDCRSDDVGLRDECDRLRRRGVDREAVRTR